jgi:hypothetical protein
LKNYGEFWTDDILPVAREAHERLQFINVHETDDQGKTVMSGDAREKNMPDRVHYADWTARVVMDEMHKAGWRLADLLSQAVGSTSATTTAPIASPEPIIVPPGKSEPSATLVPDQESPAAPTATPGPQLGTYPANYQEIVITWMKKYSLDALRVEWNGGPKPGEMPAPDGQNWSGYLVIFNTPDRNAGMKTRSVLIRDSIIVANSGFDYKQKKNAPDRARFSHKQDCVTIYVEVFAFSLCSLHSAWNFVNWSAVRIAFASSIYLVSLASEQPAL